MPCICLDMSAVEHNFRIVQRLAREWRFCWLPVLKMVAGYGPVEDFLRSHGVPVTGAADVDEHLCFGRSPDASAHVYINIVPPSRAGDVVRRFRRSCVSSPEGMEALEQAAEEARLSHDCLLMLDLGDGREGVRVEAVDGLAEALERRAFRHVRLVGVGVTLGCLNGLCPDSDIMRKLFAAMRRLRPLMPVPTATVSLGGSIFWNWFAIHHEAFHEALARVPGWQVELRMGDPLLVGFDMYRSEPLLGGDFRRDMFEIRAQVLEVQSKCAQYEGTFVTNGHGTRPARRDGSWVQALLDCGILHTDMTDVAPDVPGAKLLEYSGNYAVLDVTDCAARPAVGDVVRLRPGYWAVARAFRTPQTEKAIWTKSAEAQG